MKPTQKVTVHPAVTPSGGEKLMVFDGEYVDEEGYHADRLIDVVDEIVVRGGTQDVVDMEVEDGRLILTGV